jgi:hypothetical protein
LDGVDKDGNEVESIVEGEDDYDSEYDDEENFIDADGLPAKVRVEGAPGDDDEDEYDDEDYDEEGEGELDEDEEDSEGDKELGKRDGHSDSEQNGNGHKRSK